MKYAKNRPCIKCGDTFAKSEFHDLSGTFVVQFMEDPKHITRTCSNCGYQWWEEPLDAPTASLGSQG